MRNLMQTEAEAKATLEAKWLSDKPADRQEMLVALHVLQVHLSPQELYDYCNALAAAKAKVL